MFLFFLHHVSQLCNKRVAKTSELENLYREGMQKTFSIVRSKAALLRQNFLKEGPTHLLCEKENNVFDVAFNGHR